jgi:LysR family transcriptional regulator (chromosome initiation inhibitor)
MEYIAVASPEFHREHFYNGISLDTLKNAPCLAFDRKDTIQDQWMMLGFGNSVNVLTHMVPSYAGYVACCLNGTGWGLVPGAAGTKDLSTGELIELVPNRRIEVSLHWQSSTQSSEVLRKLGEIVLEEARIHLLPDKFRPQ